MPAKNILDKNIQELLLFEISHIPPELNKYSIHLVHHAVNYLYINEPTYLWFYMLMLFFFFFTIFYYSCMGRLRRNHRRVYDMKRKVLGIIFIKRYVSPCTSSCFGKWNTCYDPVLGFLGKVRGLILTCLACICCPCGWLCKRWRLDYAINTNYQNRFNEML